MRAVSHFRVDLYEGHWIQLILDCEVKDGELVDFEIEEALFKGPGSSHAVRPNDLSPAFRDMLEEHVEYRIHIVEQNMEPFE